VHPKRRTNPQQAFIWAGDKELKKLQKAAWNAGWWPQAKKSGILWLADDQRGQVMVHGTSSDHHAYDNVLALFRAAGLDV